LTARLLPFSLAPKRRFRPVHHLNGAKMSTQHHNTDRTNRHVDRDLLETSPSTDWRETRMILLGKIDRLAAATRMDRPARYRRKHAWGVSS